MTGNLHELHVPDDADTALDWAVRREFGMRYDSYREGLARDNGLAEARKSHYYFACQDPEAAWIADQMHNVRVKELS